MAVSAIRPVGFAGRALCWICLALIPVANPAAAACSIANEKCAEWITVAGGPARVLVYRTYPLEVRNATITRALVVLHGGGGDADRYYRGALAAAFLAGALDDTIIVTPRFASSTGPATLRSACRATLAANELDWPCAWESAGRLSTADWRTGGAAVGAPTVTSFDVADEILLKLANTTTFPNLRAIVVAGHSGGGFFVTRYAMSNQVHHRIGIPISYVVANAGAYPYLDPLRPTASALPSTAADALYSLTSPSRVPLPTFAAFANARACGTFDSWPYGLQRRTGYSARLSEDQLRKQLLARPITYLLGQFDTVMPSSFDGSCAGMVQGPNYLARGLAWSAYLTEKYGTMHHTMIVPACGHNDRCMFTADVALPILFPER